MTPWSFSPESESPILKEDLAAIWRHPHIDGILKVRESKEGRKTGRRRIRE